MTPCSYEQRGERVESRIETVLVGISRVRIPGALRSRTVLVQLLDPEYPISDVLTVVAMVLENSIEKSIL